MSHRGVEFFVLTYRHRGGQHSSDKAARFARSSDLNVIQDTLVALLEGAGAHLIVVRPGATIPEPLEFTWSRHAKPTARGCQEAEGKVSVSKTNQPNIFMVTLQVHGPSNRYIVDLTCPSSRMEGLGLWGSFCDGIQNGVSAAELELARLLKMPRVNGQERRADAGQGQPGTAPEAEQPTSDGLSIPLDTSTGKVAEGEQVGGTQKPVVPYQTPGQWLADPERTKLLLLMVATQEEGRICAPQLGNQLPQDLGDLAPGFPVTQSWATGVLRVMLYRGLLGRAEKAPRRSGTRTYYHLTEKGRKLAGISQSTGSDPDTEQPPISVSAGGSLAEQLANLRQRVAPLLKARAERDSVRLQLAALKEADDRLSAQLDAPEAEDLLLEWGAIQRALYD